MSEQQVRYVVGIDLGTTNSLVALVENGAPFVIPDQRGDRLLPSIVSIEATGNAVVGREAERRLTTGPSRTVYSVKRFMGRGMRDAMAADLGGLSNVQATIAQCPQAPSSYSTNEPFSRRKSLTNRGAGVYEISVTNSGILSCIIRAPD